ncbi:MAG: hypothetical protein K6B71_02025 [Alphaproteobacteria bacterium]|nr:hypothetical protein [Alphaproteobacteria bacterium]
MEKNLYYSELLKMLQNIVKNPENHVGSDVWNNPKSNFIDIEDTVGVVKDKNDKTIFEAPKNHDGKIIKRGENGMVLADQPEIIPKDVSKKLHDIIMKRIQRESKLERNLDFNQTKVLKYLEQFVRNK